jgi:branched-chain amino acid transport system ATP-binding protein
MLESRGLGIRFGGHAAVDGVSCAFHPGTLTAIVGPNGAGKTTYFNLLSGQLRPTAGAVWLDGHDVTRYGPAARARRGIGRAFQLTTLFPTLSVLENVRLAVQAQAGRGLDMRTPWRRHGALIERARHWLGAVGLADRALLPAAALPHGDQRKLDVAILLALQPKVLLFDEPTAGMSLEQAPVLLALIEQLKADAGRTILLVEHKMEVVRRLADRIVVLHNGQLVADGAPAEVMAAPVVRAAYLGIAANG